MFLMRPRPRTGKETQSWYGIYLYLPTTLARVGRNLSKKMKTQRYMAKRREPFIMGGQFEGCICIKDPPPPSWKQSQFKNPRSQRTQLPITMTELVKKVLLCFLAFFSICTAVTELP